MKLSIVKSPPGNAGWSEWRAGPCGVPGVMTRGAAVAERPSSRRRMARARWSSCGAANLLRLAVEKGERGLAFGVGGRAAEGEPVGIGDAARFVGRAGGGWSRAAKALARLSSQRAVDQEQALRRRGGDVALRGAVEAVGRRRTRRAAGRGCCAGPWCRSSARGVEASTLGPPAVEFEFAGDGEDGSRGFARRRGGAMLARQSRRFSGSLSARGLGERVSARPADRWPR